MPKVKTVGQPVTCINTVPTKNLYVDKKARQIMKRPKVLKKAMGKTKLIEQTPVGMANKTGSDAVIPPGHSQRKPKL